jgi:hypothetical protein
MKSLGPKTLKPTMPYVSQQEALSLIASTITNLRVDVESELFLLNGDVPVVMLRPTTKSLLQMIYVFSALGQNKSSEMCRGFSVVASFDDRPAVSIEMIGLSATLQIIRDLLDWRPNVVIDSMTRSRFEKYSVMTSDTSENIAENREMSLRETGLCVQHESVVTVGDTTVMIYQIGDSFESPTHTWQISSPNPDFESDLICNEPVDFDSFDDVLCVLEQIEASHLARIESFKIVSQHA